MSKRGIRSRDENEMEFSRIVAFSDGVFAIAITLLVLQVNVPVGAESSSQLWHDIGNESGDLFAFAVSFAVIGRFWVVHHGFFSEVRGFDGALLALNLAYLFFMVAIPFSSQLLGEYGNLSAAVVIYALNLALVTALGSAMSIYAVRAGLTAPNRERQIRADRRRGIITCGVFLASIPVAFVAPHLAPWVWLALPFVRTGERHRRTNQAA